MIFEGGTKAMNYTEMLNKIIKESGLKGVDIVNRCAEKGVKFTPNYLSVLRNTPGKIPSDEVSKAIAEVCEKSSPDILIVQAYLDKAPDKIISFLQSVYDNSMQFTQNCIENYFKEKLTNEEYATQKKEMENKAEQLTLAEFICDNMNDSTNMQMESYADEIMQFLNTIEDQENQSDGYVIIPLDKAKVVSSEQIKALGLEL